MGPCQCSTLTGDFSDTLPGGEASGIATGDLPGAGNPLGNTTPVTVITELSPCTGTDESRRMIELIHDVAPGATLSFHTALRFAQLRPRGRGGYLPVLLFLW